MSLNESTAEDAAPRDALLARLLSGELRLPSPRLRQTGVPAAEKLLEAKS